MERPPRHARHGREPTPFELTPVGFFALRTPLLPFDTLVEWGAGLTAAGAGQGGDLEQAAVADRRLLEERLGAIIAEPDVREALYIASPDLEAAIPVWQSRADGDRGRGIARALVRYLARMAGRPTPFGLFAGCSVGVLGDRTRLVLSGDGATRRSRLSVDYLTAVVEEARGTARVGDGVVYHPNQSLHRAAGRVRWVESRPTSVGLSYRLVGTEDDGWLERAVDESASGATLDALAAALAAAGMSAQEADRCLGRLVADQVLVPELVPPVTGPEPLESVVEEVHRLERGTGVGERLQRARRQLADLDRFGLGNSPSAYRRLAAGLEPLPAGVTPAGLVHVDLVKSSPRATLGPAVIAELSRAARILHCLAPAGPWRHLEGFRLAFLDRYGAQEVPLTEALDGDTGIGFGPLRTTAAPIEGLPVGRATEAQAAAWTPGEQLLLERVVAAAAGGEQKIELSGSDLDVMGGNSERGDTEGGGEAYGMAMVATVAASSEDELDRGRFRVEVRALSGPSGAPLLARFCHADPEMADHVRGLVAAEEALDPDAVFADVVYLPPGRLGNVVLRPTLRNYEIPYLGRSGLPIDQQIPVSDLMVSVAGRRVVLQSRHLDRRVVPRITSAHAYMRTALPVYRFLGALQPEAVFLPWWDWGRLGGLAFLPRVSAGRVVLAPARWRLDANAIARFRQVRSADDASRFAAVQRWRTEVGAPRWMMVGVSGEGMVVDLDNVLSVDAFVHLVGDQDEAVVEELVCGPDELCARGPQGQFASEVVVPFLRVGSTRPIPASARRHGDGGRRLFPPGSEWLQAELYGPASAADRVLRELVQPLTRRVLASGAADLWFFVRYFTPSTHLRVRFHGDGSRLRSEVEPAIEAAMAALAASGAVWKLELATYQREVERYGGPEGVVVAETLFAADSEAAIEAVRRWPGGDQGLWQRWRLALGGADLLLNDLSLALRAKLAVACSLRDHAAAAVGADAALEEQLSRRFRAERGQIEALVERPADNGAGGAHPLAARSAALAPVVAELDRVERAGRLSVPRTELAAAYVHMHANRMLRSEHRAQELVIYDFLSRVYRSQMARQK